MLDVFNSDAFNVVSLTDAINKIKFVPGRVSSLGLFEETSSAVTTVAIEQKDGTLVLVPPSARGGPGTTIDKSKRSMLSINVPHFQIDDAVMAEEVQGVRAFGSEDQLDTVLRLVGERLGVHAQSMAATEEHARLGAIKGVVTYADSSTLDLFTTFGVSQISEKAFDFANKVSGELRAYCAGVIREIAGELGGTPFSGAMALCSDTFFDALLKNAEVRASYLNQQEARELRSPYIVNGGQSYGSFEFGGIIWENYRGSVGATKFIDDDKCHIFPLGVPRLFRTVYAPADYMETVNTLGRRLYAKQFPMRNDKGVEMEVQSNALHYCTRPRVLIKGKLGS